MRDDITVVVTTINSRREMAKRAIASAKDQAHVIVADDGDLPRWHGYATWWEGIYRAETPYVAILHDDDWYEPTFIERCGFMLDAREDVGFVFTDGTIHFADGVTGPNLALKQLGIDRDCFLDQAGMEALFFNLKCTISPTCVVMRREDALNSLLIGGVPGAKKRSVVCGPDLLMVMLPILKHQFFGVIVDQLVHMDGGMQSTTIEALQTEQGTQDLLDTYADARNFYMAVKNVHYRQ